MWSIINQIRVRNTTRPNFLRLNRKPTIEKETDPTESRRNGEKMQGSTRNLNFIHMHSLKEKTQNYDNQQENFQQQKNIETHINSSKQEVKQSFIS